MDYFSLLPTVLQNEIFSFNPDHRDKMKYVLYEIQYRRYYLTLRKSENCVCDQCHENIYYGDSYIQCIPVKYPLHLCSVYCVVDFEMDMIDDR